MAKAKQIESTSTEIAVISPEEQAYLDSLRPAKASAPEGPARLVINTDARNEDGKKLPIGAWHITGTDIYFDGEINFRPVRAINKLISYVEDDNGKWQMRGESVYFTDYREEILDSLGGIALGRKFGSKLSDEEKEANKKLASVYYDIFGFVDIGDGESRPVLFRTRGGKMYKMGKAFESVPKGKEYSQYNFKLETLQEGAAKYWTINVTPDLSKVLPISPILAYDKEIGEYIKASNENVIRQFKQNAGRKVEDTLVEASTKHEIFTPDDDLPF